MEILKQKKAIMANFDSDIANRKNPNPTSGIHPTSVKVVQYRMADKNRI